VFDILELKDRRLRELPLTDRRQHLNKLLARTVIYPVPSFRQRAGAAAKVSRLIITVLHFTMIARLPGTYDDV
jgi:ATP-dependent DNA ligase